ncbi:MAG TPA: tetratricopeptide repeat protein [Holophagaceae bacterium]|nr:tetratricopeptide repeat protein [Holophagaceae bacterium]
MAALALAPALVAQTVDEAFLATSDPKVIMIKAADKALSLGASDSRMLAECGQAHLAGGDQAGAEALFKRAVAADPLDSETRQIIAHAWFLAQVKSEALASLRPLQASTIKNTGGHLGAALDLLAFDTPEAADALMEVARQKEPKASQAQLRFGEACLPAHPALALKWLKLGAQEDEATPTLLRCALLLLQGGDPLRADEVMQRMLSVDRDAWSECCDFASAARRAHQEALALKYAATAKDRYPPLEFIRIRAQGAKNGRTLGDYGRIMLALGDRVRAEALFAEAIALSPKDSLTHQVIAEAWFKQGFQQEGRAALEPLKTRAAKGSEGYWMGGLNLLRHGTVAEAEQMLEAAFGMEPRGWERCLLTGKAFADSRQAELAEKWLKRGVIKKEATGNLVKAVGTLLDGGFAQEASTLMDLAYRVAPKEEAVWCEFGRAAVRNHVRPLAAKCFQRALALKPKSESVWNEVANAYAQQGVGTREEFKLE